MPTHTVCLQTTDQATGAASAAAVAHATKNTITEYVRLQRDSNASDTGEKVQRLRERAARHQLEAERLQRRGDSRQADTHASIARTHAQSALALEAFAALH